MAGSILDILAEQEDGTDTKRRTLAKLPKSPLTRRQQAALAAYEFSGENLTHWQIAERLGVKRSAITRRLKRARQRLEDRGFNLHSGEHAIKPDRRHVVQMSCFTDSAK